ncbi:hypothetical protein, conserved [Leishmania tarentolae]|uniref:Nucleoporin n=1 Tax=Leishmania tarentolae TaxID=5689 RepID=A0A640KVA1_LEITA|nr:hypothetical protein, conserved [Leishmania tarentolae]
MPWCCPLTFSLTHRAAAESFIGGVEATLSLSSVSVLHSMQNPIRCLTPLMHTTTAFQLTRCTLFFSLPSLSCPFLSGGLCAAFDFFPCCRPPPPPTSRSHHTPPDFHSTAKPYSPLCRTMVAGQSGPTAQGSSPILSTSLQEAFLRYDLKECQHSANGPAVEEARPMLGNRYFNIDHLSLWKPSLLASLGETCRRAMHVNEYHALLCSRRLVLVNNKGRYIVFPPFRDSLNDAYVERISKTCTLVLAGVASGVYVALIRDSDSDKADTLQSAFCSTASAVSCIHHLGKNLYGLCCENCTVERLVVTLDNTHSPYPELHANLLPSRQGWVQVAYDYLSPTRYVHSLFDRHRGYLLMLSSRNVSLWLHSDETHLQLECSAALPRESAVAIVPPLQGEHGETQVAVLITRSGGRVPVYLQTTASKRGKSLSLSVGELRGLPSGMTNTVVSLACACDSSLLLADQLTSSLLLVTRCEPFCEAPQSSTTHVVTQHFLGKPICGVGVEKSVRDGGSFLTFLVYYGDSTIVRLGRMPRGQLLQRQFLASVTGGIDALRKLEPQARVVLLLDAVLSGLPISYLSQFLEPLLHPYAVTTCGLRLSHGARGIIQHTMEGLRKLSRLCLSFHYWGLTEELAQLRSRLEKSCIILTEVLNRGGWLDCPTRQRLEWDDDILVRADGKLTDISAVDAQAEVLQLLLTSVKHATTIVWLYELLLQTGATYRFPDRLENILWKGDPVAVQVSLCMDLLGMHIKDIADKLLQKEHVLPQRCRLAATLLSLVLDKALEPVMTYTRQHILDFVQYDLLAYTTDLLESSFPTSQPHIRLLVYRYPHDHSVSSDILSMLESILSTDDLYNTLVTILGDAACDNELSSVLLDWMEGHTLADHRILTFAKVVVDMGLCVDPAHTLTGRFFSSVKQQANGNAQQAALRFAELARSDLSVPLDGRLLAIEHAIAAAPSDGYRLIQFLLLLQQQLASLIAEHLTVGKDLVFARSTVEADLRVLREHYVSENSLFELAGRYKVLGGCSIQLDLLKIHSDSPEPLIANAVTGVLTFLKAVGLSGPQAVQRVLREYLGTFQAPLPIFQFVEFLAFDGQSPARAIDELEKAGVPLPTIFDTFMSLLDGHRDPLFQIGDTVLALGKLVPKISLTVQHICAAHLLECSRSMLAGEQRAIVLTEEDVHTIKRIGDDMRKLSQRSQGAF